jgi:hypothetical protein
MSRPSPFSWFAACIAAAFKTDFYRLYERIDLALKAIETRLDGPKNLDDAEFTRLQDALRAPPMLSTDEKP